MVRSRCADSYRSIAATIETSAKSRSARPDGAKIPIKQLAMITEQTGAFIIYRENNERYIPIKFSVRGRDLERTVKEAQAVLAEHRVSARRLSHGMARGIRPAAG